MSNSSQNAGNKSELHSQGSNSSTRPHAEPLVLASVWECASPAQADAILGKSMPGYVYQRDGHPNGDSLANDLNRREGAAAGIVTSSGMAALAAPLLAHVGAGDKVVFAKRLYGRTHVLAGDLRRLGVQVELVDLQDLQAARQGIAKGTKLVLVETIANPLLEVADVAPLAEISHAAGAILLVDNTFASPPVCKPLSLGADLVMESLTKTLNGHSDVILGYVGGSQQAFGKLATTVSTWGMSAGPFDCWLAHRGLATADLRIERSSQNALQAAEFLSQQKVVKKVFYPGLPSHPGHALAKKQFSQGFGTMVTFELAGGRAAADQFISAAKRIPFCPSLGELNTTLSHPETTSHRGLTAQEREALGISGGTIRLSVGAEAAGEVAAMLAEGLAAI
ncbi:MAG: aminotransferase class V-fold PLP-dependent enzyme [Pirellulales bacterium]